MTNALMRLTAAVLMGVTLATGVGAQGGGKAEPSRISFARNASSASVQGSVRGDQEAEYSFEARQGQKVTISVKAMPKLSVAVELRRTGAATVALESSGKGIWTAVLTDSGEYLLIVKKARQDRQISRYTLTLAIRTSR